jgi:hypothetical protein
MMLSSLKSATFIYDFPFLKKNQIVYTSTEEENRRKQRLISGTLDVAVK